MTAPMLALPAPSPVLALPAPPANSMSALFESIKVGLSLEQAAETKFFVQPDEFHALSFPSTALAYHSMILGHPGGGKSLLASTLGPLAAAAERGKTKLVTIGGDDELLADLDSLSPVEWTLKWQSWFPASPNEAVPRIEIREQSESGMLLAVDVAWSCNQMKFRLQDRFPHLNVNVELAS